MLGLMMDTRPNSPDRGRGIHPRHGAESEGVQGVHPNSFLGELSVGPAAQWCIQDP